MRHTRFYTAILLTVMILNIFRYQLPYIEYGLFKDYIAENLCVKRNEANNNCRGQCHLEKQMELVSETDNNSANPAETGQTVKCEIFDCIAGAGRLALPQNLFIEIEWSQLIISHFTDFVSAPPVPPPQRFC